MPKWLEKGGRFKWESSNNVKIVHVSHSSLGCSQARSRSAVGLEDASNENSSMWDQRATLYGGGRTVQKGSAQTNYNQDRRTAMQHRTFT